MTDPRIAPLAAALHEANVDCDYSRKFDKKVCNGGDGPHSITAAAILAALPSGWCGHSLTAIEDLMDEIEKREVEIARLRAIEEVNQRTRNWIDQNLAVWSDDEDANSISMAACDLLRKVRNVMDTGSPLRAALGSER